MTFVEELSPHTDHAIGFAEKHLTITWYIFAPILRLKDRKTLGDL
jgi:hypothetical protein